jgi:hypothetical protein
MASQHILIIPPLDGNLFTGPTRMLGGAGRIIAPTLNVPYGEKMRFIYVGSVGTISFQLWNGTTITLPGLEPFEFHEILSLQIFSVGTTATGIFVAS